jgi:hypothetical protein
MAVTAMPAVVTATGKGAIRAKMAAMETARAKSSTAVKPSPSMAAATVGECTWCDRQHSGNDQSDNFKSAHYTTPFLPHSRAVPPGTIIGSGDALSAELMALGASQMTNSKSPVRDI